MNNGAVTFLHCTIVRRDLVFISAQVTALNAQGIDHTKVLRWKNGAFAHFMIDWATTALSATGTPLSVLSMGLEGDIHVFQGAERRTETIVGPGRLGPLRDMRLISGSHYAVGMQRQAYRRHADGSWQSIAEAIGNHDGINSFDSIDGFSANEVYATGMDGALWAFDGQHWQTLQSPSSVALQRVHCSEDGRVYIVGQGGTLLCGRGAHWEVIALEEVHDDLWGVQTFKGMLFVASSTGVYRWAAGTLKRADIGTTGMGSASFLTAGDGVLWSVGHRHLAYTDDGEHWTSVDYDDASY